MVLSVQYRLNTCFSLLVLRCKYSAGGYMVQAAVSAKYVFDLQPGDVYWCTADCGEPP